MEGFGETEDEVQETEIKEERTTNSTIYQLSDGQKKTVFYGEDVRYKDEDGNIADYDASLKKVTETSKVSGISLSKYAYENTAGNTKNYIPKMLSDESPILMTNGDYTVGLTHVLEDKIKNNEFLNQFGIYMMAMID